MQIAASYEHTDVREYETLLAEATDPQLEDERLIQVPAAPLLQACSATYIIRGELPVQQYRSIQEPNADF